MVEGGKLLPGSEHVTPEMEALEDRKLAHFENSNMSLSAKLASPGRFLSRQQFAKLICYVDVVRMTEGVTGSIVECGVYNGNGLMMFAKLIAALEPYNYNCQVFGFDTFGKGNLRVSDVDQGISNLDHTFLGHQVEAEHHKVGGYVTHSFAEIAECVSIFDEDRPLGSVPKTLLLAGDICETAQRFVKEDCKGLIIRILSLSMNLYEPTKAALKAFLPRMPKGSIIMAFTLNSPLYPGMTQALIEEVGLKDYRITTPAFYPNVNYVHIE